MRQLLALFLFVGFISCGSATTVKGTFATSYSGATVVAVSTNSPGTIISESKVAADGSFSLALNQDSAKTFLVLVPTSGSFILVAFNGDGKTANKLNIAANKGTFDLGTITVTNGRAHATLSASAAVLIDANDNTDDDVLADVVEPVRQKFPNQQLGCTVWSTQPKEGETVQPGKPIKLRFTQAIDKASFNNFTFSGAGVDKNALGNPSYAENDFQVMFNPSPNLAEGSYTLTLPTSVTCASQTGLDGEFKLQFTVKGEAQGQGQKFEVLAVNAEPFGVRINFTQAVDKSTIKLEPGFIELTYSDGSAIANLASSFAYERDDKQVNIGFTRSGNRAHKISVGTSVKSASGTNLQKAYSGTF